MIDPGRRAERRAELFQELASTLEAGLPMESCFAAVGLGPPSRPGEAVTQNLEGALGDLHPVDRAVLSAGEHRGELPKALRARARRHQHTAATRRELLRRLLYPVILVVMVTILWGWLEFLGFGAPTTFGVLWFGVLGSAIAGGLLLHRRARNAPGSRPERWPVLGTLYADTGVLPYLESLGGLLGAGIRIDEAHERALRTVPWAGLKSRLFVALAGLERGETYAAAVHEAGALDDETERALRVAEQAGDLEATAVRLAALRVDRLERRIAGVCKLIGAVAYLGAATLAIVTIMDFYSSIASGRFVR